MLKFIKNVITSTSDVEGKKPDCASPVIICTGTRPASNVIPLLTLSTHSGK